MLSARHGMAPSSSRLVHGMVAPQPTWLSKSLIRASKSSSTVWIHGTGQLIYLGWQHISPQRVDRRFRTFERTCNAVAFGISSRPYINPRWRPRICLTVNRWTLSWWTVGMITLVFGTMSAHGFPNSSDTGGWQAMMRIGLGY